MTATVTKTPSPTNELEVSVSFNAREAVANKSVTITIPEANLVADSNRTITGGIVVGVHSLTLNIAQPPAAPKKDVTAELEGAKAIDGVTGVEKKETIAIQLTGGKFDSAKVDSSTHKDVKTWFEGMESVDGFSANIMSIEGDTKAVIELTLSGNTEIKHDTVAINIPNTAVVADSDYQTQGNTTSVNQASKKLVINYLKLVVTANNHSKISAAVGTQLTGAPTVVLTSNVPFKTSEVADCLAWFTELAGKGLTASGALTVEDKTLTITFGGTPTATLSETQYSISIPKNAFAIEPVDSISVSAEAGRTIEIVEGTFGNITFTDLDQSSTNTKTVNFKDKGSVTSPVATLSPDVSDATKQYSIQPSSVASVEQSSGALTINTAGKATVTYTVSKSGFASKSATYNLVVTPGVVVSSTATTIPGEQNKEIPESEAKEITITLTGDTFKDIPQDGNGVNFKTWLPNLPTGLEVKKADTASVRNTLKLKVYGTPSVASTEKVTVIIPAEKLTNYPDQYEYTEQNLAYAITAAQSQPQPQTPSATVTIVNGNGLGIIGLVGTTMKDQELKIVLKNATFKAMNDGLDVKEWFTNPPAGITYHIKGEVQDGATELTVKIGGSPTQEVDKEVTITILVANLNGTGPIEIQPSDAAKYNFYTLKVEKGEIVGTVGTAFGQNSTVTITSSVVAFNPSEVSGENCLDWFDREVRESGIHVETSLAPLLSGSGLENRKLTIKFSGTPTKELARKGYKITIPAAAFVDGFVTTNYVTKGADNITMSIGVATATASAVGGGNLVIDGERAKRIEEKVIEIAIDGAKFEAINEGQNVDAWFGKALGLTYTIKEQVTDGAKKAKVAVNGEPNADSTDNLAITIKAAQLKDRNVDIVIAPSNNVKFNIATSVAKIKDVTIVGTVGKQSASQDVEITLKNATFENVSVGETVTSWFGMFFPLDMEAKVRVSEPQRLVITISGTPGGVALGVPVSIMIPGTKLVGHGQGLQVEPNNNAKFMIDDGSNPAPSPTPERKDDAGQNIGNTASVETAPGIKAEPKPEVKKDGDSAVATLSASVVNQGSKVSANISASAVEKALKAAEELAKKPANAGTKPALEITVNTSKNAETSSLSLSKTAVEAVAKSAVETLTVTSGVGTVTLDKKTVESVAKNARGSVALNVEKAEKKLNEAQKKAVGDAPIYDITIVSGNTKLTSFDGGMITVEIPYTLKEGQKPNGVVVWYVDEMGNIEHVEAMYNVKTQSVIFTTNHLSKYAVAYDASKSDEKSDEEDAEKSNDKGAEKLDWMNPYSDVMKDAWYYDAVKFVTEKGLMNGDAGMFSPMMQANRAMIVTILHRVEGIPAVSEDMMSMMMFQDVMDGMYYTDAVKWAAAHKIVSGRGDGTFAPDLAITRQELAVILKNYASYKMQGEMAMTDEMMMADLSKFKDADMVSDWAKEAMDWAVAKGIINGKDGEMLDPQGMATRAEIAQMLKSFMEMK